jgi:hypothetical protein
MNETIRSNENERHVTDNINRCIVENENEF